MAAIATQRRSYRDSQTPAQQLYADLCVKGKVRPDAAVSEGLASRGLTCSIDKWTPPDCSVISMLARKLKGYTHISITLNAGSKDLSKKSSSRRSRAVPVVGPDDEAIVVLSSAVSKSLSICPKLVSIELPGMKLNHSALRHLGRGLLATSSLKRLDVRTCGLGDDGLGVLVKALIGCKSLNDLCLAGNRLRDASAPRIASVIRRHGARRDDGFWASCLRDGAMSAASTRGLEPTNAEINVQLHGLTALDVSDNYLTNEGARYIAATLESDGWLVALNMRGNQLSVEGANALKAALQINESLSVIDFRPREEPPKFDDMGHIVRASPRRHRQEMMGWAMRRKPRKGIGAEHPSVHVILTRWGLAGERSNSPALSLSSTKKSSNSRRKSMASQSFDAKFKTSQQTRMAANKGSRKSTPSSSDIDTKRSSHASTTTTSARTRVKAKGKASKKRTTKRVTTMSTTMSTNTRPKSSKAKTTTQSTGESLPQRFASMERPRTAFGGNRSRRRDNKPPSISTSSTLHPGIVGLGQVESDIVGMTLSKDAESLISSIYERVQTKLNIQGNGAVPVRDVITALREEPAAPAVLYFRGNSGNPPVDLLEQGKMVTKSASFSFFEIHAKRIVSLSPRGKHQSTSQQWASAESKAADPALLEALEGWVDQLHGYIDKLEQGVDLGTVPRLTVTSNSSNNNRGGQKQKMSTPSKSSAGGAGGECRCVCAVLFY